MEIEPLSKKTLSQATAMLNEVFPVQSKEESSDFWLPYSLGLKKIRKIKSDKTVVSIKYWVGIENGNVIGIVGLYEKNNDSDEVCWLSWFCVIPDCRGRGLGTMLLDFAIKEATKRKKKYIRLYTSTDPNEAAAQSFYEKRGFAVSNNDDKIIHRFKYKIFYRELKL